MASGVAALKVAAVVAVFAMLVMSSTAISVSPWRPIPRPIPIPPCCSDCFSQCNTSCTAIAAANCSSYCSVPAGCEACKSQVLHECQDCCNSNGSSSISCHVNSYVGDCVTCGCNNCQAVAQRLCMDACRINYLACQACKNGIGDQCNNSCTCDCMYKYKCVMKGGICG